MSCNYHSYTAADYNVLTVRIRTHYSNVCIIQRHAIIALSHTATDYNVIILCL